MGNLEADFKKADPYTTGRPRKVDLREVINAIWLNMDSGQLSNARSGGDWGLH